MRISDWSSDVRSSDLVDSREQGPAIAKEGEPAVRLALVLQYVDPDEAAHPRCRIVEVEIDARVPAWRIVRLAVARSVERRVGKECVSACRYRWSPCHLRKKTWKLKVM